MTTSFPDPPPTSPKLDYASKNATPSGRRGRIAFACAIGFIALVLFAWLLPSVGRPKPRAQRVKCASNLRQIGQGLTLYANDHKGRYPPVLEMLIPHADLSPELFVCPMTNHDHAPGPTTQQALNNFRANPQHCSFIYLGAALNSTLSSDHVVAYEYLSNHNHEGMNVLYNDGHVDWLDKPAAQNLLSELSAGQNPPRQK